MAELSVRSLQNEQLAAWSITIIEFVKARDQGNPMWGQMLEIVKKSGQAKSKVGMRMVARDISEFASGLSHTDREALCKELESKFGPGGALLRARRGK